MALPVSRDRQEHTRLTGLPVDFGQIWEKKEYGNKNGIWPEGVDATSYLPHLHFTDYNFIIFHL